MSDNDVYVKIGADTSELNADIDSATAKIRSSMDEINKSMVSTMAIGTALGTIIGNVLISAFAKLSDTIKSTVADTAAYRSEAEMLGRKMGDTATNAATLTAALGNIYTSSDEYIGVAKTMERNLASNEAGMNKMGITTRDASGHFLPLNELILDGIAKTNEYRQGTDRNIASTQIFGRAIEDGSRLLNLSKQAIEDAAEENRRYGLVVGVEAVADMAAFKVAQDDVGDSLDGMSNAIGNALLPVVTQLSKWFADIAPTAILVLKGAIGGIVSVFWGLKLSAEIVWNSIALAIEVTTIRVLQFANTAAKALSGDFSGAKAAWEAGTDSIAEVTKKRFDNISMAAEDTREKLRRLFDDQTEIKGGDAGGLSATTKSHDKKGKSAREQSEMAEFRAELEKKLETENGYFKDSTQLEIEYWNTKKNLVSTSVKDKALIEHTVYELSKKQALGKFNDELETIKRQSANELQASEERVRLAQLTAQKIAATYGLESREYTRAMRDVQDEMMALSELRTRLAGTAIEADKNAALMGVEVEAERISHSRAMNEIDDLDQIIQLIKLEDAKYQIESKAAKASAALIHGDVVAQAQAYAKIEQDSKKHDLEMQKLRNNRTVEETKVYKSLANSLQNSMQTAFTGVLKGTMSLAGAMKSIFSGMVSAVIGELSKIAAQWAIDSLMNLVRTKITALAKIQAMAGEAGAGGVASMAAAPFPLNLGAPAFGATMAQTAMGFAAFSAEGGFDIPSGVNPLVQTHAREMILPAEHADTIRSMGGKGGGTHNHYYDIKAMDAKSFASFLKSNSSGLASGIGHARRNFAIAGVK